MYEISGAVFAPDISLAQVGGIRVPSLGWGATQVLAALAVSGYFRPQIRALSASDKFRGLLVWLE
jgi:hypothetical protein